MNILIVGNGFDLSHYLPTKYDHFMDVMGAIENWGVSKGDMNFDDLFGSLYEKEDYFFGYTKAMYKTDEIKISVEQIKELQKQLKENVWYQYFSDHVREVKTWIDFEQKIENALILVSRFMRKIDSKFDKYGKVDSALRYLTKESTIIEDYTVSISKLDLAILDKLKLCVLNENYGKTIGRGIAAIPDRKIGFISDNWFHVLAGTESSFVAEKYISFLNQQLEEFIEIFNLYLKLIVGQLSQRKKIEIDAEWSYLDKIFSFNYTNTCQRLHDSVAVEYLHGSCGEYQNIVLGVSDLESESLKKIKAYGFTKYQQKLFKDTDYLFLDNYKNKAASNKKEIEDFKVEYTGRLQQVKSGLKRLENESFFNLNFYIWGHSLDVSDKDYVIDLFSLNDDIDRNVRVTVYYFNKPAKFALLNNLLAILKKDKVEQWMKNKWLQFKENPEVRFLEDEKQEIA